MEKRDYLIILYDYYGDLLDDDDKMYFEYYYFDNLSLAEIAENNNVSRNAIHKHIKNTVCKLEFYESKLSLYEKDKLLEQKINNIKDVRLKESILEILNFDKKI